MDSNIFGYWLSLCPKPNRMKAFVFPGQGAQFPGMAKDLYEANDLLRNRLEQANEILGFRITDIMFDGTSDELKQTKVTQPAIFLHSVVLAEAIGEAFQPEMVAGHSLGELFGFSGSEGIEFRGWIEIGFSARKSHAKRMRS